MTRAGLERSRSAPDCSGRASPSRWHYEVRSQRERDAGLGVAVLGAGNVGANLSHKLLQRPGRMALLLVADTDAAAVGLRNLQAPGLAFSDRGVSAVVEDSRIDLVFDATTATAHHEHAPLLREARKVVIDLTPSGLGPVVIPHVNLTEHLASPDDLSLATSAGQATVPLVRELAGLVPLLYVEVVSVVASASVGLGMRLDMDESAAATARALKELGGACHAKAITILNPADPPVPMRSTLYAVFAREVDHEQVTESLREAIADVQVLLPGYGVTTAPRFETPDTPWGRRTTLVLHIEVIGAGSPLSPCVGNLELITCAARDLGEELAWRLLPADGLAVTS